MHNLQTTQQNAKIAALFLKVPKRLAKVVAPTA
jgi:hypothetical protein